MNNVCKAEIVYAYRYVGSHMKLTKQSPEVIHRVSAA